MGDCTEKRRGIPAARAYCGSAKYALCRYRELATSDDQDQTALMLYYGAFFVFARGSIEALRNSDGATDVILNTNQLAYFRATIEPDPIYDLLKKERDRVAHGEDSWAAHPYKPIAMLERHSASGYPWGDVVFNAPRWPEAPFEGQPVIEVLVAVWNQIRIWLDDLDAYDKVSRA
ncbi:hypothetical protein [Maricaulis sp.]|uniref:hypothetical protein n=1 Tax=Maricaulis sp. TaxID=1486257 RepID=UPI002B278B6C|nr:hypothetical protein [Maricaulis sp.]